MTQAEFADFARGFLEHHREDPPGPVATRSLFENERVQIWEMRLEPGEASALHRHERDYLVVLLEGDQIGAISGPGNAGRLILVDVAPGHSVFVPRGGTEWAVNTGKQRYREILIELKEDADGA